MDMDRWLRLLPAEVEKLVWERFEKHVLTDVVCAVSPGIRDSVLKSVAYKWPIRYLPAPHTNPEDSTKSRHAIFKGDFAPGEEATLLQKLPQWVTRVTMYFKDKSRQQNPLQNLPASVTHLTISGTFFFQPVVIPSPSVTHLKLRCGFTLMSMDELPSSVTHLILPDDFDQPVANMPSSVTHLTFGYLFNRPVENLPAHITHLTFGYMFNQPVNNLPSSLTHLRFGHAFNKPVENLPAHLTHLEFHDA